MRRSLDHVRPDVVSHNRNRTLAQLSPPVPYSAAYRTVVASGRLSQRSFARYDSCVDSSRECLEDISDAGYAIGGRRRARSAPGRVTPPRILVCGNIKHDVGGKRLSESPGPGHDIRPVVSVSLLHAHLISCRKHRRR